MAAADGGSIQTLQKHIEDMRSLVMCKICLKPFYEPYILSCGHTYCYSCLNNWFNGNAERRKNNKNCPDCRTLIKVQPAPNYLLRDLTHMFIGRIELLPEDESVEEHVRDKDEEALLLIRDRSGHGLFGGLFKNAAPRPIMRFAPIQDYEDGVIRCPECAWEIEDGICTGCGLGSLGESDMSLSDSIDDDMSEDSGSEDESAVSDLPGPLPIQQFYGVDSESEEDEDDTHFGGSQDQDHYDVHDDFVDDDIEVDVDDMNGGDDYDGYPSEPGTPYSDGTSYTVQNDDEHDAYSSHAAHTEPHFWNPQADVEWGSDAEEGEDEDEDEDIRPAPRQRRFPPPTAAVSASRRRPVVISDDDEDGEEEQGPARIEAAPLPVSENEVSSDDSVEDDDGSEPASDSGSSSSDDSSESDDTIIPPQSRRDRRQRLEAHRARRSAPSNRITVDLVTPPHPPQQRNHSRPRGGDVVRNARKSRVSVH